MSFYVAYRIFSLRLISLSALIYIFILFIALIFFCFQINIWDIRFDRERTWHFKSQPGSEFFRKKKFAIFPRMFAILWPQILVICCQNAIFWQSVTSWINSNIKLIQTPVKIRDYFRIASSSVFMFNMAVYDWGKQDVQMAVRTLALFLFLALLGYIPSASTEEVKLGLLIPFKRTNRLGNYYHRGEFYASAMSIAVDDVNRRSDLLPGKNVTFIWNDTDCEEFKTLQSIVYQLTQGVSAFIGPGCSCNTSARMAASFNKTMISYVSNSLWLLFLIAWCNILHSCLFRCVYGLNAIL